MKPGGDDRFQSMLAISQDHFVVGVEHDPGSYTFTKEDVGTRYLFVIFRTFVDPDDESDIAEAHRMQDRISVSQSAVGSFEVPDWDNESLDQVRSLLNALSAGVTGDVKGAFGSREEIDPVRHLLATGAGWGVNPPEDGRVNRIPITAGWNYVVRLYRPGPEVLDGSWTFPEAVPLD